VAGTLGRIEGAGNVTLDLSDAARATRWLARWPGATALLGPTLAATQWHGQAQLNAQWQGGWQNQGHDLALTAQLRSSEFDWAPRTDVAAATAARALPAGRSRALQVNATGSLDQLQVNGSGDIGFGAQQIGWRTRVQAGRTPAQAWRAQVEQLDLDLRIDQPQQRWQLSLGTVDDRAAAGKATVVLDWVPSTQGQTLSVSAGLARIKGPLGGTSHVQWQPLRWSQGRPADDRAQSPAPQWQTQGQIDRLPLAWVDLLGGKTLTDLGLGSDLTFSGQWDAAQGNTLHASLLLERSAGDVHLLAGTVGEQAVAAGMRETRLQVNLDGDRLSANLRWDSQRAGRALMAFSTQLQQQGPGGRQLAARSATHGGLVGAGTAGLAPARHHGGKCQPGRHDRSAPMVGHAAGQGPGAALAGGRHRFQPGPI